MDIIVDVCIALSTFSTFYTPYILYFCLLCSVQSLSSTKIYKSTMFEDSLAHAKYLT